MRIKFISFILLLGFTSINCIAQNFVKEIRLQKIPVAYQGEVIDAYQFKDNGGEYIYLVSKVKVVSDKSQATTTLFGYKYMRASNGLFAKQWELKDAADDILLYYKKTKITDIDKDGNNETIFVYQMNPDAGEGSDWRLVLDYKGKKYLLKAHIPVLDSDKYSMVTDKGFDTVPADIKKFAVSYWNSMAKELNLKTK